MRQPAARIDDGIGGGRRGPRLWRLAPELPRRPCMRCRRTTRCARAGRRLWPAPLPCNVLSWP